jgi:hypothetical protein
MGINWPARMQLPAREEDRGGNNHDRERDMGDRSGRSNLCGIQYILALDMGLGEPN